MTPEEKREERFKDWLAPAKARFVDSGAEKAYRERVTRLARAIRGEEPDRVPVLLPAGNYPAYYAGHDLKKVMYDYEALRSSWSRFLHDFYDSMDSFSGIGLIHSAPTLELLNFKLYKWPGGGLADNVNTYQYVEGEYMSADEYDALIKDPSDFALRVLAPRMVGAFEPLRKLTHPGYTLGMPLRLVTPVMQEDVQEALLKLVQAGKEMAVWAKSVRAFNLEAQNMGFPTLRGGMGVAPFDTIGDSLRGTKGVILDMYRRPEKLIEAMERITPIAIEDAISMTNASRGVIVSFPLHKGDDTFMNQQQFEKFYWPTLRKFILALIQEGIMVSLFAEGRFNSRLEAISDLPPGWVLWHFDQTDMAQAKKVLGGKAAIAGNVPSSLVCTRPAREVKEYCRRLIETCAPGGGYILSGGASATETCPENLRAFMEAAVEYGTYPLRGK
jgi:uroporphyrinogen-III decarboxylase